MAEICDEIYFYDNSVFVADIKDFALKLIATMQNKKLKIINHTKCLEKILPILLEIS